MSGKTLNEVRETIADIKRRYGITHSKSVEDQVDGEIKFVDFTIRFKVGPEKKPLDFHK